VPGCVSSWRGSSQRTCPPSSPSAPAKVNRLLSDQSQPSTFRPKSTVYFQTKVISLLSDQSQLSTFRPKPTVLPLPSQHLPPGTQSQLSTFTKVNCLLSEQSQQSTFRPKSTVYFQTEVNSLLSDTIFQRMHSLLSVLPRARQHLPQRNHLSTMRRGPRNYLRNWHHAFQKEHIFFFLLIGPPVSCRTLYGCITYTLNPEHRILNQI